MGLILRSGEEQPAPPAPVAPPGGGPAAAGAAVNLGSLKVDALPQRDLPHLARAREGRFQVAVARSVLDDIRDHGRSEPEVEVCGVLVGNVYRDASGPFLHIDGNIRGNGAAGRAAQVTFTADTWKHIQDVMEQDHPDDRIVGWYHTHPGFGIFLSDMDLFIQNNFFAEPWQVAFVYDPKSNEQGLFLRRGEQTIREKFLVDEEGETAGPAGAAATPRRGNATDAIDAGAAQMVAPGTIAELSARVQRLERRQRWFSAKLTLVLLLAVLWPVAVVVFLPSAVRRLPPEVQRILGADQAAATDNSERGGPGPTTAPARPGDLNEEQGD